MAIALGIENKRQVFLVIGLFALVAAIGGHEVYSALSGPSARPMTPATADRSGNKTQADSGRSGTAARELSDSDLDPTVRIDELAQTEHVEYSGASRNIFSPESAPVHIEAPIAPARPEPAIALAPVLPPKPPEIDIKYLGYEQGADKSFQALIVHGSDLFMASTGDIMFHRYKLGVIQPASVQVTDLSSHNTQTIPATTN